MKTPERKYMIATTLLLAIGLLGIPIRGAVATPPPPGPPNPEALARQFIDCFREEFNPTNEQLDFLERQFNFSGEEASRLKDLGRQLETMRHSFETQIEGNASEAELLSEYEKMQKLKEQLGAAHFKRLLDLRNILNPEQRKKLSVCRKRIAPPPGAE